MRAVKGSEQLFFFDEKHHWNYNNPSVGIVNQSPKPQ